MSRILGIDHGMTNVGIAISDPSEMLARELTTIKMTDNIFEDISAILKEYDIDKIVLGLPLGARSGKSTDQTDIVSEFGDEIKVQLGIDVDYVDERFTSKIALKMPKVKSKIMTKDSFAAMLILQTYLDMRQ
jgi:putative Holliday junction resolvase